MNSRSIVILGGPFPSTAILYNYLKNNFEISCVIIEKRPSRFTMLRKRAHRLGTTTALGQLAFRTVLVPLLEFATRRRVRQIAADSKLDDSAIPPDVVRKVESANGEPTIAMLREANPAVVLVNGTRILSQEVLDSVSAKFVNLHTGITPQYRGVHGGYWALVEGRKELCGVTLHLVDSGIDTGTVLAQAIITPNAKDNFATYPWLQVAAALPLLNDVLPALLSGTVVYDAHGRGDSRLWSHPTLLEYVSNRFRKGVR